MQFSKLDKYIHSRAHLKKKELSRVRFLSNLNEIKVGYSTVLSNTFKIILLKYSRIKQKIECLM
jgi:hypothetical protein